jgi:hypothetical protein
MTAVINTVRTTISLPRELKARMDEAGGLNCSALAADAIRARLNGGPSELDRLRQEVGVLRRENASLREAVARVRGVLDSLEGCAW